MHRTSGIIFIEKAPILTKSQIAVIAEISRNSGLAVSSIAVIPYLFGTIDKPSFTVVTLAGITTLLLWIIAIILVKNLDFI